MILVLKEDMIDIESLKERFRCCYEQAKRIHVDRTSGSYRNNRAIDGDIDACVAAS